MKIPFRHEKIRKTQALFIGDLVEAIEKEKHLVANAPTGIGKTDAVLSVAVHFGLPTFFLTPKISQHKIAVDVIKGIERKFGLGLKAADVIGKKYMCVDPNMAFEKEEFYEMCKKRREKELCPYYNWARGYGYRERVKALQRIEKVAKWYFPVKIAEELVDFCAAYNEGGQIKPLCAYEVVCELAKRSTIIICDFYHLLNPHISKIFLSKIEKSVDGSVIIIDEAHNAPERVREALSSSLSYATLKKAMREAELLRDKRGKSILGKIFRRMEKIWKTDEEKPITMDSIYVLDEEERDYLRELGLDYLEISGRARSACISVARFYERWIEEKPGFFRMVKKHKVMNKCLDPAIFTGEFLNRARSVILMSGTLIPMEMYRDLLGLDPERTIMKNYPEEFPRERKLKIIDTSTTTQFSKRTEREFENIGERITSLLKVMKGNVAVFFPSYDVLKKVLPYVKTKRPIFIQKENASPEQSFAILNAFKNAKDKGGVLFGVCGGSYAEGIDLPGEYLRGVIVVGVPLAEPTLEVRALIDYYEEKFGKGWSYGYILPAIAKALQAIGRVVRSEEDFGVCVLMDYRYVWKNYSKYLPKDFIITQNPEHHIQDFLKRLKEVG